MFIILLRSGPAK